MSAGLSDLDRSTLQALKQHGDDHTLPRHVVYWLFFPSDAQRRAALAEATAQGWSQYADSLSEEPGEDGTWILGLDANHDLTDAVLGGRLRAINAIAAKHDGDFDGWEAQIAERERPERPRGLLRRLFGK